MNLDTAFSVLRDPELSEYPEQAFSVIKQQWMDALPQIDALVQNFIAGDLPDPADDTALFFSLLLLADQRETSRFHALLELCTPGIERQPELDSLLGDAVTELLPTFIYILADGRPEPLIALMKIGVKIGVR